MFIFNRKLHDLLKHLDYSYDYNYGLGQVTVVGLDIYVFRDGEYAMNFANCYDGFIFHSGTGWEKRISKQVRKDITNALNDYVIKNHQKTKEQQPKNKFKNNNKKVVCEWQQEHVKKV